MNTTHKAKHTPGPWHAAKRHPNSTMWRVTAPTGDVAWTPENLNNGHKQEANARLIAAAPALLEAAKAAREVLAGRRYMRDGKPITYGEVAAMLQSAIAQAEPEGK